MTTYILANPIWQGDLVCLLLIVPKLTIIRIYEHYFVIIIIAVTPLSSIRTDSGNIEWADLLGSIKFSNYDFRLVWDWTKLSEKFYDRKEHETLVNTSSGVSEHSTATLENHLARATDIWRMALMLEDLEEYNEAEERFKEAVEICDRAFGMMSSHMPTIMHKHIQIIEEVVV